MKDVTRKVNNTIAEQVKTGTECVKGHAVPLTREYRSLQWGNGVVLLQRQFSIKLYFARLFDLIAANNCN